MRKWQRFGRNAAYEAALQRCCAISIDAIYDFLVGRNPCAAGRMVAAIRASARLLIDFPHIGRKGEEVGTREWAVRGSPYLIVYEVDAENEEVWVLGVFHGAQQRPGHQQ